MTRFQSQKSYKGKGGSDNMRLTDHSTPTCAAVGGGGRELRREFVPGIKEAVGE